MQANLIVYIGYATVIQNYKFDLTQWSIKNGKTQIFLL